MRAFKTTLLLLALAAITGGVVFGYVRFSEAQRQKKLEQDLALAHESLKDAEYENALMAADRVLESGAAPEKRPELLEIRARAFEGLDRREDALEAWDRLRDEYPDAPRTAEALSRLAMDALDRGGKSNLDRAYKLFQEIESRFPDSDAYNDALFGYGMIDVTDGQLESAQKTLLSLLELAPDYPRRDQAEEALGEINLQLLRSSALQEGEEFYTVKPGDTLYEIGRKFDANYEMIMLANGIDNPSLLRVNKRLKIPNVDWSIEVDKSNNTLTLLNHGKFFKKYDVRTGTTESLTPVGRFKVIDKAKDPTWYHDGRIIPPGDPENELGSRWLAFQGSALGIHEAIDPESIGTYSSNGCVGMLREDVEELYDLVPKGTPVHIYGERKSPRENETDDNE